MKAIFTVCGTVAAVLVLPSMSHAQALPDNCDPNIDAPSIYNMPAAGCSAAAIGRLILLNQADVIRRVTAVSFGIGPQTMEAAGLTGLTPEEAVQRLDGEGPDVISPTADVVATPPASRFNVWADGKYTWNDSSMAAFDLDGPLLNGQFGIDYKITPRVTLGLMGTYERSHLEGGPVLYPEFKTDGWGLGPYFGVTLTPNIVWSGSFVYSNIDTNQNDTWHYDSDRYQAATAVTGYFYSNTWRFSPSLSVTWSREYQSDNAGVLPDETIETAILSPSLQVGDTLRLGATSTVEPWLGAAFDYTFVNRIEDDLLGTILDDPTTDLRLQAGMNFGLAPNVQLSLIGEMGGLLLDNSNTYSGEANLAIQF